MTNTLLVGPEAQAAFDRAQAHWDGGDLAAALSECDQALQAAPHWAEAHNLRGIILDELGRTEQAVAAYQQALHLDPALTDAAENLSELQAERGRRGPLWKRLGTVALPIIAVAAIAVTVTALEARRGPDWQLALNEYIAQRAPSVGELTVQNVVTADHPASFVPQMGRLMPGGMQWEGVSPVFPPRAVQCVVLASSDGGREVATAPGVSHEVVYVAYHSDGLHHLGWRVYEAQEAPFTVQLQADLQTLGCALGLQ